MGKKRERKQHQNEDEDDAKPPQQQDEQQEEDAGPSGGDGGGSGDDGGGSSDGGGESGSGDDEDDSGSGSDEDGSSAPEVSDEEGDDPDDDDGEAFEEVNVSFEFFDPKEIDFHGLKALLHTYLDGEQYDASGLVDTIIAQSTVGTVVKTGEDDDPIAVMTALSTRRYAGRPFAGQVKAFLLGRCKDEATKRAFEEAWDADGTGLVINERLINAPPSLAPPLVQALFDEVAWATEDEPTQELRDSFKFKRYILITRVYTDPDADPEAAGGSGGGGGKERKKKKQRAAPGPAVPLLVYVRPEDEFLHARAAASATWPVEGRPVAKDELRPARLALLVTSEAVGGARRELDRVVGNAAAMAPPPPPAAGKGAAGGRGTAAKPPGLPKGGGKKKG